MITKEEAIERHRTMWHEIAKRTRTQQCCAEESEVFKDLWPDLSVWFDCWCCEYDSFMNVQNLDEDVCDYCPIVWGGDLEKTCSYAEYGKWIDACNNGDWKLATELAYKIAQLPERNCTYE